MTTDENVATGGEVVASNEEDVASDEEDVATDEEASDEEAVASLCVWSLSVGLGPAGWLAGVAWTVSSPVAVCGSLVGSWRDSAAFLLTLPALNLNWKGKILLQESALPQSGPVVLYNPF